MMAQAGLAAAVLFSLSGGFAGTAEAAEKPTTASADGELRRPQKGIPLR